MSADEGWTSWLRAAQVMEMQAVRTLENQVPRTESCPGRSRISSSAAPGICAQATSPLEDSAAAVIVNMRALRGRSRGAKRAGEPARR